MEDSVEIEVHRRMDSEDNESEGEEIENGDVDTGQRSFDLESEEEVSLEQRQLSYPPLPVYKSPMPSPAKDRIGLLTPTEELSEGEQSVVRSRQGSRHGSTQGSSRLKTSESNRRVSFNHPIAPLQSPRSLSPDIMEEDIMEEGPGDLDGDDLNLNQVDLLALREDGIEELIRLQSRQELVLNWQEKHLQHNLSSDDFRDILHTSSTEMDPSTIMKSLRTMQPSNFAPMVQQMTDSLATAYQSHLSILNTISLFGDRLRELQPFDYNLDLLPLLKKLCTLVGESRSSSPDLSAAVTLSKLIRGAGPSLITEDLLYIINGSNMKRKPAAMDGLTFALLTFPRDDFDIEKIAEAVSQCLWDPKRRIRQAALECLAVVAHVLGPGIAMPFLRELIEQNRPVDTRENPSTAVSARVSRRLLPSPSPMGLIDYGLTLPSKQFSKITLEQMETGGLDPILSKGEFGPDVLWILHGTEQQSKMSSARSSNSSRHGSKSSKSSNSPISPTRAEMVQQQEEILRQKHREYLASEAEERRMKETLEKVKFQEELERKYEEDFHLNEDYGETKTNVRGDRDSGVSSLKSVRIASPAESTASSSKSPVPDEAVTFFPPPPISSPPSISSHDPESDDLERGDPERGGSASESFVIRRPVMPRSSRSSLASMTSQTGRVQHSPPPAPRPATEDDPVLDTAPSTSSGSTVDGHNWLKKSCPTKLPVRTKAKSKPKAGAGATAVSTPPLRSPHDPPATSSRTNDSPKHVLAQALRQLNSSDWEVVLDGFATLTRILHTNPEFLKSELLIVNRAALLQLSNLRSQVTRAACQFYEELFATYGKSMEQDCEKIAEKLLDKTADTSKFIREASTSALVSMVIHLPPAKTIGILDHYGAKHRNTIVRCTTAHVTRLLVQQMGAEKVLHQNPQKLLPLLIQFLQEGSLETRTHAKHGLASLVVHGSFESALKRYIPSGTLKQVEKSISSIKNDLIRKG